MNQDHDPNPEWVDEDWESTQKALEILAKRQIKMLAARDDEIYRDVMRQYMPAELFGDILKRPIPENVARWLNDNEWNWQLLGPCPNSEGDLRCKEIRRGKELIARHYFQVKAM